MAINHTNCTHPRTPAGRKSCRDARIGSAPDVQNVREDRDNITPAPVRRQRVADLQARLQRAAEAPVKLTGPVARRMARQAVAADNARATTTACVQVELHTGAGRCACGWEGK